MVSVGALGMDMMAFMAKMGALQGVARRREGLQLHSAVQHRRPQHPGAIDGVRRGQVRH